MSVAKYYPFSGNRGRLHLGLHPIKLSDWIQYEDDFCDRIQEKKKLIGINRRRVLDSFERSIVAQQELLNLVLEFLRQHGSNWFEINAGQVSSLGNNTSYTISDYASYPLELISYLVIDDYCLLEEDEEDFKLIAASICVPTWWELSDKMGKPLTSIHAPIANLEEKIGHMIRHFLKNLSAEDCYQRSNWFLFTRPDFCVFPDHFNMYDDLASLSLKNIEEHLYLRTERQTFRKLKNTGAIAFGIKVYTAPISIVRDNLAIAKDLIQALDTMDKGQKQALAIDVVEETLRRYLDKVVIK